MSHKILSKKQAHALSFALFLVGIAILFFLNTWWPAILLVIGLPLAVRQYFLGKHLDMAISLFVFVGLFITIQFNVTWKFLIPLLFILGALYIFLKEFMGGKGSDKDDHLPPPSSRDNGDI